MWTDGRTINISYLSADNNGDRFPTLIDECLKLNPDVIAVTTTPAAHLLKRATKWPRLLRDRRPREAAGAPSSISG